MARERPSSGAFAAAVARNRHHLYSLLVQSVAKSGLTQAQIAEWAGISPEHMSRLLARPRNIEWDTASRVIFAACGATIRLAPEFPREAARTHDASRKASAYSETALSDAVLSQSRVGESHYDFRGLLSPKQEPDLQGAPFPQKGQKTPDLTFALQ
jgi:DNA-binding phage protein